jgi:integrase
MSSISTYKGKLGGTYRAIQFVGADRKRRSIRLGGLPAKDVESIKERIDLLEVYRKHNRSPDTETAQWVGRIDGNIYDKLAAGGLVEPRPGKETRKGISLGAFLENYIGQRQALVTAGKLNADTLRIEKVTRDCLVQRFGADKLLDRFTEADAEDFRHFLLTIGGQPVKRCGPEITIMPRRPLAESTTRKRCSIANKFFRSAVRRGLITRNPFDTDAVPKSNVATSKHAYIKAADAQAVLDKLPDTQWKLIFALCRWGGLRIGEVRLLTWADVQWDESRLLVHSPKTARYKGHATRLVPLWPEIAELLDKRYHDAPEGDQYVLPMLQGRSNASLRKVLQRAIEAAGVAAWPRLFHNLRGTRQNELLEAGHARKAVCAWMGNSDDTAEEHYEKCTEADWSRATAPLNAPPTENVQESRR